MSDELDDLRATADDLADDARRLQAIETTKVRLAADDPQLLELSHEAERLTHRMASKASAERELAEEVSEDSAGRDG